MTFKSQIYRLRGLYNERLLHHIQHARPVFSRFLDLRGNLGKIKEKLIRKICFSHEKKHLTPRIDQAKFFWRHFFEVNGISILFSWEIDVKTRESISKSLNTKAL